MRRRFYAVLFVWVAAGMSACTAWRTVDAGTESQDAAPNCLGARWEDGHWTGGGWTCLDGDGGRHVRSGDPYLRCCEALCGPLLSGCHQNPCPAGNRCEDTGPGSPSGACVPSRCSCEESDWDGDGRFSWNQSCTADCNGGICVPERDQ